MAPPRLPPCATGPEQRRRRRRLTRAGLLVGSAGALLASGLALEGPASGRILGHPAGLPSLALLLAAGVLLALRVGAAERALAGSGYLLGRASSGAGLALLLDAFAPLQWDRAAFALGLAALGAWLSKGAAPPREWRVAPEDGRSPARGRTRRGRGVP